MDEPFTARSRPATNVPTHSKAPICMETRGLDRMARAGDTLGPRQRLGCPNCRGQRQAITLCVSCGRGRCPSCFVGYYSNCARCARGPCCYWRMCDCSAAETDQLALNMETDLDELCRGHFSNCARCARGPTFPTTATSGPPCTTTRRWVSPTRLPTKSTPRSPPIELRTASFFVKKMVVAIWGRMSR